MALRLMLVTEHFPPRSSSAAVQLRDLSREFVRQGHQLTVLLPDPAIRSRWTFEKMDGAEVLRLKMPSIRGSGYICRTLSEALMPLLMMRQLRTSTLFEFKCDGIIWYSPSIFHGPLVRNLKKHNKCRSYLIIRDIFPEWAVDTGLIRKGISYYVFKAVAHYQYSVADVIGVQSPGNLVYFTDWIRKPLRRLEVLNNWLGEPAHASSTIRLADTSLAGRRVLVYSGNIGVAQGLDIILEAAAMLLSRADVGFLFVGRGSELQRLRQLAETRLLSNVLFMDEIDPNEIPDLYAQCDAGMVVLDSRHKSHNIPGKFLSYMQNGLPVLASINLCNDLAQMIRNEKVGQVNETNQVDELVMLIDKLLDQVETDSGLSDRCRALFQSQFTAKQAVKQLVTAFSNS